MSESRSDALVFLGATGDLAYKKIFPALQAMAKRGHLNVPVIGVAKSGWNLDQFRARVRDSVEKHGGLDPAAFDTLCGLLRYVDGDYQDPATFRAVRETLGPAQRPAYYLAIPPALFGLVVEQLSKSGCTKGARVILEKPFGRDLVFLARKPALNSGWVCGPFGESDPLEFVAGIRAGDTSLPANRPRSSRRRPVRGGRGEGQRGDERP